MIGINFTVDFESKGTPLVRLPPGGILYYWKICKFHPLYNFVPDPSDMPFSKLVDIFIYEIQQYRLFFTFIDGKHINCIDIEILFGHC